MYCRYVRCDDKISLAISSISPSFFPSVVVVVVVVVGGGGGGGGGGEGGAAAVVFVAVEVVR